MKDSKNAVPGPDMAKSNSCVLVDGNDRSGVIDPKVPISNDGSGTGSPIFRPD